jgi:hypothetical protein
VVQLTSGSPQISAGLASLYIIAISIKQGVVVFISSISLISKVAIALGVLYFIKEVPKGVVAIIFKYKLVKLLTLLYYYKLLITFILYYLCYTKYINSKLIYKLILLTVEYLD